MTDTDDTTTTDDTRPTIYERMSRILRDLPAIGKDQVNEQQGFKFRGYDDVLDALNPVLAEHGVFFTCEVVERIDTVRQTRSGSALYVVAIKNRYRFFGPRGDCIPTEAWGEGTDTGDKATPKAMTGALKYALFQVFAISTHEADEVDQDRHSPEPSAPVRYVNCPECQAEIADDAETKRGHLERVHGWTRQADGTVAPPESAEPAPVDTGGDTGTDTDAPAEAPQAAPAGDAAPSGGDTPGDTDDDDTGEQDAEPVDTDPDAQDEIDVSYVDDLKGADLMAEAERVGVAKSGRVAEVRDRIKDHLLAYGDTSLEGDADDGDEAPADGDGDDAGADTPDDTPADDSGDETDGDGDDTDDAEYECPECEAGPFTIDAYHEHWFEVHDDGDDDGDTDGDDAEDTADAADEAPITDANLDAVKARISELSGANARAYGKYRREQALPRPDEMTNAQAVALLVFLDELDAG